MDVVVEDSEKELVINQIFRRIILNQSVTSRAKGETL